MNRFTHEQMQQRMKTRMKDHNDAREVKRLLAGLGFTDRVSLYAVIINPETRDPEYRRIEVFLYKEPDQNDFLAIRNFFDSFTVFSTYSIWVYDHKNKQIVQAGSWK